MYLKLYKNPRISVFYFLNQRDKRKKRSDKNKLNKRELVNGKKNWKFFPLRWISPGKLPKKRNKKEKRDKKRRMIPKKIKKRPIIIKVLAKKSIIDYPNTIFCLTNVLGTFSKK